MHGIVILDPGIDQGERRGSARDRADPDVIAFEGFDEGFGHAIAFQALDRGEARHQVECGGDVDRPVSGEDRAIIRQPLHRVWRADVAEPLFDAAHHHIADHLAGDAGGCRHPTDHLAVMAIEGEGGAHHLAIPAGELECVGAPADVRTDRRDLAVKKSYRQLAPRSLQRSGWVALPIGLSSINHQFS